MKRGGLIDRTWGALKRRREARAQQARSNHYVEEIQRKGREWVAPKRGGEHRPVWKMAPTPGMQRDALRGERRDRRARLGRKAGKGICGYATKARAGQLY